jgi:ceramide glucosyltransferase
MSSILMWLGSILTVATSAYALLASVARARIYYPPAGSNPPARQPVTMLKPLCGLEPRLEENLVSICEQTYPDYQIVFGVRDPNDAAIQVVERLKSAYPQRDIELVVDSRIHGANFKVSNLINMAARARYPWIVLADSDIAVVPDYLEKVTPPLADASVGIVTCLYRARPLDSFWSRMAALFIDTWFAPSVRVASSFGSDGFGFGATIALRADALAAIGGFSALRNCLADDFWLGELTRAQGLKTVLSEVVVTTDVIETGFAAMWSRERRWMLTIRSLNRLGYAFTFVTFTFPLLALGLMLAPTAVNLAIAAVGILARMSMHVRLPASTPNFLYAPLRDVFLLLTWASAFLGSTAKWRGQTVRVQDDPAGPAV